MLAKEITSLQHPIVKNFVKLRTDRHYRYEMRQIVISGRKIIEEMPYLDILIVKKGTLHQLQAKEIFLVTDEMLKKITGLETPEPFAAVVPMPEWSRLENKKTILALDGISDPGNLGTLLRTALGLGWEGAFLTESSVDPYNDKALRAAKGATFRLPLHMGTEEKLLQFAQNREVLIADAKGKPLRDVPKSKNLLLILGNESQGVSKRLKDLFPAVSIPIQNIESLNVAAAGAILLYNLRT